LYLPLVIPALAGLAARPLAERLEPQGGHDALRQWPPGFFPARITRLI
jgi:hypothetical protein